MGSLLPHTSPQGWKRGSGIMTCRNGLPGKSDSKARMSFAGECAGSWLECAEVAGKLP